MPLSHFRCPDGVEIDADSCLSQCRLGQRCVTKATLLAIKNGEREWDGIPHVTQLLNGTMLEFLRITKPYTVDPQDRAFALLGSAHHKLLEEQEDSVIIPEIPFETDVAGTSDSLEWDDRLGGYILTDYKTWGSFRVAKALGLVKEGKGKYARFTQVEDRKDLHDVNLQLNMYRIGLEGTGWKPIKQLQVQATVRDGGTYMARNNGIDKKIYTIPIDILLDDYVNKFFDIRSKMLKMAIDNNHMPYPCDDRESWGGRRCAGYCEVANYCPKGRAALSK